MTVEFYWSPFLTEFDLNYKESGKKVLVLDRLSPNSVLWSDADIMVFNSGHWWAQTGKYKRFVSFVIICPLLYLVIKLIFINLMILCI